MSARRTRSGMAALALAVALLASACGVSAEKVEQASGPPPTSAPSGPIISVPRAPTTGPGGGGGGSGGGSPQVGEHWHMAFGTEVCGAFLRPPADAGPDELGIHTHQDGAIHIHPFTDAAAGRNAVLALFFDDIGGSISDSRVEIDGKTYDESSTECDGEPAEVRVAVWESALEAAQGAEPTTVYDHDFGAIPLGPNQSAMALSIEPKGSSFLAPPSAAELRQLAAADGGGGPSNTLPSVAGKPCIPAAAPREGAPDVPTPVGPPPTHLMATNLRTGTGPTVEAGDLITVDYVLVACTTGQLLGSSYITKEPYTVSLSSPAAIPGWVRGIPGMQVGGRRLLVVPPDLGFGEKGSAGVASDETLVFVIDLVDFSSRPGRPPATPTTVN